jgi:hypothetical protein
MAFKINHSPITQLIGKKTQNKINLFNPNQA